MSEQLLGPRELNRALFARQLLLERRTMPLGRALERIDGIQAQFAPSMSGGAARVTTAVELPAASVEHPARRTGHPPDLPPTRDWASPMRCNGVELNVEQAGEGGPVLLLHGFPDSAQLWRNQIPVLAQAGHHVIAPDLPGYGASEAPGEVESYRLQNVVKGVVELLDQLGIERTAVVGHDWGAAAAWGMASLVPDRVERLVALSVGHPAVPRTLEQMRSFWYMLLFQYPEAEELLSEDDWSLFRRWMEGAEDLDRYLSDLARPRRLTAALNWYRANLTARSFVNGAGLPPVTCPTLGAWSAHDFVCTEQQMLDSEDYVSAPWRYEHIDGAGHWIPLAAPERLNKLLLGFLG